MKLLPRDKYSCTCCGVCCKWPGYVRMTDKEVGEIADFLGLSVAEFTKKYTHLTNDRRNLSLIENEQGHCIFLTEDNRCVINDVKPQQCRDFPFKWRFFGWRKQCKMKKNY